MLSWTELLQLQWRTPWAALLLLLPLLLAWLGWRREQQLASYADPALQPWAVAQRGALRGQPVRRGALALAWLLLAVAAAGPRLPVVVDAQPSGHGAARHVIDVMVVFDVSASMAAADVAPDRLSRARLELQDLTRRLQGERLGLLPYAGQAGVLLPPTDDAALFVHALQQTSPALFDAAGTDVARALALARTQLLDGPGDRGRAVLLVTDGDAASLDGAAGDLAQQAARELRAADITLYVLLVASEAGSEFELPGGGRAQRDGAPYVSRPALDAYRQLARAGGGELALVRDGDADWERLYDAGLARLPGATAVAGAQQQAWRELYGAPLAMALLLLLVATLPPKAIRVASPLLLVCLLVGGLTGQPAQAAEALTDAQAAARAYRAQQWAQALPLFARSGGYAGEMGAGASAWQLRDHATAAQHFRQALVLARGAAERDDALYNLGNALYAQQQWLAAAQAWRAVLLSRPDDVRAAANLKQAERQLAHRDGSATKSDLRGRRGFTVEGFVGLDGAVELRDEPLMLAETPQGARGPNEDAAQGARLNAAATATDAPVTIDARQLQSGLAKLERVQERPRELLRGLLRQDRAPTPSATTGAPW